VNTVIIDQVPQNVEHFSISLVDCSKEELHSMQSVSQSAVLFRLIF
jgi:hypothetical protein